MSSNNVLILAPEILPFPGGAEAYATYLVESLSELGWGVICVTNQPKKAVDIKLSNSEMIYLNPNVENILDSRKVPWREMQFDVLDQLSLHIDRLKDVSIVHANSIESAIIGRIVADHLGVPLVATIHENAPEKRGFGNGLTNFAFCRLGIDQLIAPSMFYYDRALRHGTPENKVSLVHHGIPADRLPFELKSLQKSNVRTYSFIFVGRIYPTKGLHVLLKALGSISVDTSYKLTIVGQEVSSDYLDDIRQQIYDYNLQENIEFAGVLSHRETTERIAKSDLLICPSLNEGFGLVALEAMHLSTPIIASKVGGLTELISHEKTGILVKSEDSKELASAIVKFMNSSEVFEDYAENAKKIAQERFSSIAMAKKTITIYENAIREKYDINRTCIEEF